MAEWRIERLQPVACVRQRGARNIDIRVRHLRERVHARVGAARSVQLEVAAAGHCADGPVDLTLDGSRVLLNLPAAETRAGIFDGQPEPGHAQL
jgi:hypothetical protein